MTESAQETKTLFEIAEENDRFLAEVTMYTHHRQFHALENEIAERRKNRERLLGISTRFSIPELDPGDIRYSKEEGGGALLDVGYYPISLVLTLFGAPHDVCATGYVCPDRGIDLSGQALLIYEGFSCHCFWAIGSSYSSNVEVSFTKSTIKSDRIFSKPADLETSIERVSEFGKPLDSTNIAGDDQFEAMFKHFETAQKKQNSETWKKHREQAILVAQTVDAIRALIYSAE